MFKIRTFLQLFFFCFSVTITKVNPPSISNPAPPGLCRIMWPPAQELSHRQLEGVKLVLKPLNCLFFSLSWRRSRQTTAGTRRSSLRGFCTLLSPLKSFLAVTHVSSHPALSLLPAAPVPLSHWEHRDACPLDFARRVLKLQLEIKRMRKRQHYRRWK